MKTFKDLSEALVEQTAEAPSLQKHRIGVRVTNPNNKREVKYVVVTHSANKKGAQAVGEKHFKKKGYFVHDSFHSGMVNEEQDVVEATDDKKFNSMMGNITKKKMAVDRKTGKEYDPEEEMSKLLGKHKSQFQGMAAIEKAQKKGVAEGTEQPIKKSDWFNPTDSRSPEKQKAAYLNHLAAKKKNKNIQEQGVAEEVELTEDQTEEWKSIQAMDKGSVIAGKEGASKKLAYLKAVLAFQRKYGKDTLKTKKEIESINRSRVAEEVELDEAEDWGGYSKRQFKSREMEHELGHEVQPKRSAPATSGEPHAVHINGKKWKTFQTKSHATNVANKIKGATVVKESVEELNTKQKNEGTEMLSFKYYQVALEEAKKARKESEIENAHTSDDKEREEDELEGEELDEAIYEALSKDATAGDWISDFVHSDNPKFEGKSKEKRKQMALAAYYAKQRNEEVEELFSQLTTEQIEEFMQTEEFEQLDELSNKAYSSYYKKATSVSSLTGGKSAQRRAGIKRATTGMATSAEKMRKQQTEEVDEAMSQQAKTTMKHVKNATPGEKKAAKDIKPGVAGYRDRIAMLQSAAARGGLKNEEVEEIDEVSWQTAQAASNKSASKVAASKTPEEREKNLAQMKRLHKGAMDRINATPNTKKGPSGYQRSTAGRLGEEAEDLDEVSPFDWKAYAKEKAKSATTSGTTKTYHDVKKTSTGTVYTKQSTPDGISKGSGEDAAKAEEPPVKRGRGRPAGVGAKAGGYKPRDPAKKAASAAKAAASKAANRAMRKESFDEEFMGSLIEGFEEEDFEDFLQCEEFDDLDESTRVALLNFINEKSCGSYKMKESLTGKQHKLDKNKNGKLDSQDFKLLRKEETEQIQESVSKYAAFLTKKN